MKRLAALIVDKKAIILILFLALLGLSLFTGFKVKIQDDIYEYLPEDTETKQGLNVMDDFVTYSTARIMIKEITYSDAARIADKIEDVENVRSVVFDDSEDHFRGGSALIDVTFNGGDNDEESINALEEIRELTAFRSRVYISTTVGYDMSENIVREMATVGVMSVAVVLFLLLLTSRSYAEVPPLLLSYGMAAILQWGSNYIFGEISFIANSVTLVLQLALAIDYSVILCNRFAEEKEHCATPADAMKSALSKAIPEVFASSLTTIGGLLAMTFMQFRLGYDVGRVLIKAILISLVTVFAFLPAMLLAFNRAIDRTKHRSFIPKVDGLGKMAWLTRKVIPPIFVAVAVFACIGMSKNTLSYNYQETMPLVPNESYTATYNIRKVFGFENRMAVVVPAGDYASEAAMLEEMANTENVISTTGIAGVEVLGGYKLTDKVSLTEFAEIAGLDELSAQYLFAYYGIHSGELLGIDTEELDINTYKISVIDLFNFLYESAEKGTIPLEGEKLELIEDLHAQLADAQEQLQTDKYSRVLVYANVSVESEEAHELVGRLHDIAESYYGEDVYVVGEATCARDLQATFQKDNLLISGLSALFVVIIIIITFRSFGLAVLLIAVIQGSIWLNFAIPMFREGELYFLAYLIVVAMQMGANIDYAIVVSNRYLECRERMDRRSSIIIAMNKGIATIVTSGSILAVAGFLIAVYSSTSAASHIGLALGRGTVISLFLVLFVLPQILLWGDGIIIKTSFRREQENVFRVPALFDSDFEEFARREQARKNAKKPKKNVKRRDDFAELAKSRTAPQRSEAKKYVPDPEKQVREVKKPQPVERRLAGGVIEVIEPRRMRGGDDFEDLARQKKRK